MREILYAATILLAGCGGAATSSNTAAAANGAIEPAKTAQPATSAKDVSIDDKTDVLEWHLGYPAVVGTMPKLEATIRGPALKKKAELLKFARDDKAERGKESYPFNSYEASNDYSVAGATPRLLSLASDWYEFTGGAHPNHGTGGLLWDKAGNRAITVDDLFSGGAPALQALFASLYCKALDKDRLEKRGSELDGGPDDPFNACPKFAELSIIPQSKDASGPFTSLLFHANPYVAGPYAEGDYDIELPVTAAMIAALKPEYRASFAAPR